VWEPLNGCRIFPLWIGHGWSVTSADAPPTKVPRFISQSFRWIFLNRRTGRITVAQWPNISLSVFILSSIALHFLQPQGTFRSVIRAIADVTLIIWAVDEVLRGVNPFRRILGAAVLVVTILGLTLSAH
jgi:hypothetical protein